MRDIAKSTVREHRAAFTGVFVAALLASALVTALGVLAESGLRGGPAPERYEGASVVVGAGQSLPVVEDVDPWLAERARVPADTADEIAALPGVRHAAGDVSVPVGMTGVELGDPLLAHGWSSAALTPYELVHGTGPAGPDEVVLDAGLAAEAGVGVGDRVQLTHGAVPATYDVTGTAAAEDGDGFRRTSVFLTDGRARSLTGHPELVDAVGVLAEPGVDAGELAGRIEAALPGGVRTYTGERRADVEFLDVGGARMELITLSGAFAGTAVMIALFVVASTLALSVHQRRREFALLRAVGATPRQIHRMVGAEITLVAGVAVALGLGPGFGVAVLLRNAFAAGGMIPDDFGLAYGPVPAVIAAVLCLTSARAAGWVAARRPARIRPVEALGEAAVEPPGLSRGRVGAGWVCVVLGLGSSSLPLFLPGTAAVAGAGGAALFLVLGTALLGPRLMFAATTVLAAPLRRLSGTAGYLAAANSTANTRRIAAAVTPLVLAIAIASVQLFTQSTVAAAAEKQTGDGIVADYLVSGPAGLDDEVTAAVRDLPGVATATPVVRSEVIVDYDEFGDPVREPYAAQGVVPERLADTMDLDVRGGSLDGLGAGQVAVSAMAAETIGVDVGDRLDLVLGDGTAMQPTVAAIYGRGLGFGDVTLPHDVLSAHTTTGLTDTVLVAADPQQGGAVGAALNELGSAYPGLGVTEPGALGAAGQDERDAASWANIVALLVVLVYLGISVVNTLVLTTVERGREFALLRLVGATARQVRRMMRAEALIVVLVASVTGTLVAALPLMGVSLAMTESPLPSVPVWTYLGIVGTTALLGVLSISVPARASMRTRPVDAIGTGH